MLTATSQPTSTLVATHRPTSVLVAYNHRPARPLVEVLEEWRRYKTRQPPPRPAGPLVVELPKYLLN
jgi:hypothetical protein